MLVVKLMWNSLMVPTWFMHRDQIDDCVDNKMIGTARHVDVIWDQYFLMAKTRERAAYWVMKIPKQMEKLPLRCSKQDRTVSELIRSDCPVCLWWGQGCFYNIWYNCSQKSLCWWSIRIFSYSMQSWGVWYKSHAARNKCSITRIKAYPDHCQWHWCCPGYFFLQWDWCMGDIWKRQEDKIYFHLWLIFAVPCFCKNTCSPWFSCPNRVWK